MIKIDNVLEYHKKVAYLICLLDILALIWGTAFENHLKTNVYEKNQNPRNPCFVVL